MVKCIFCKKELSDGRTVEICDKCGEEVWDKKMFKCIKDNMDNAKSNGDLCHMNNTCNID